MTVNIRSRESQRDPKVAVAPSRVMDICMANCTPDPCAFHRTLHCCQSTPGKLPIDPERLLVTMFNLWNRKEKQGVNNTLSEEIHRVGQEEIPNCKESRQGSPVFSKEPLEATLTLPHKNPNQTTKGSIVRKITEQEKTRPYSVDNRHPVFPSLEDRIDKAAQHPKTMFGAALSSPLGSLSSKQALELAKVYLENARSANDSDIAMVLYHDTKVSLSQAKKVIKRAEDPALIEGIASAYIDLAEQLETRGRESEAQYSYKKAAKLGGTTSRRSNTSIPRDTKEPLSSTVGPVEKLQVPGKERNDPSKQEIQEQQIQVIVMAASHIFTENVRPPAVDQKLPEPDERLVSTPQSRS
ncbi:hypothetical protein B0O80DRAFT_519047 [Mortierella sp. GBAus27b]|nr:hypothetical protein B0O80DRAFT_519047 [Mortierella sp. GBAus27b]